MFYKFFLLTAYSLDLAWTMCSGGSPFFFYPPECWSSALNPQQSISGLYQPPFTWDIRLTTLFLDFQHLSATINIKARKNLSFNAVDFLYMIGSLQSRLLHLANAFTDPVQELIRLTLIAFLTTTFKMPGRDLPYTWIGKQLEGAYSRAAYAMRDNELRLWVLMVAAISVAGSETAWVRDA